MDLATRKRVISSNMDAPAHKIAATSIQEPPTSFVDILFVNLLNALNATEPSQRLPLLDDMISRLQWLKQYHQQIESHPKKPIILEKSPITSPRHPAEHKPLDHQQMKRCIQKDQEMLQTMSKLITLTTQPPPPPAPPVAPVAPVAPVVAPKILPPAQHIELPPPSKKSPVPIPVPPPPPPVTVQPPRTLQEALAPIVSTVPKVAPKKVEKEEPQQPVQPLNPKQFAKSAEEMMLDLQDKQRTLLSYISAAHDGKVTDEVLHDYLRHPFVRLKENGVIREHHNPFYHLMSQNGSHMKMMPPLPAVILKPDSSKPSTPIPAPPVLVPQVKLPMKKESISKKETSPIVEKVSPPPQLPPQLPLQVPHKIPYDPTKTFLMPITRQCNQWSVVSMALPLKLICRCYQTPCKCQH